MGAEIELPCVNRSHILLMIDGKTIFLGLGLLKDVEWGLMEKVLQERYLNGNFEGLQDFINRIPVSLEPLTVLIRIGAFRFTGKSKKELLWDAHFLLGNSKKNTCRKDIV